MSEPDNFLSRWSRRKLEPSKENSEAVAPETKQPAEAQPAAVESRAPATPVSAPDQTQEPPFDLASLPPIESITAGTDIRDFLKPGVPLSLSRAALRRAWSSDPAIRDFVGLAENQWDFTNGSIAGFGSLDPADVPRLLARIIGQDIGDSDTSAPPADAPSEAAQSAPTVAKGDTTANEPQNQNIASAPADDQGSTGAPSEPHPLQREGIDAMQKDETDEKLNYAQLRNGHGSALPS